MWFLLTQLFKPYHSIICQSSHLSLLFRFCPSFIDLYLWTQVFHTWVLFLSLSDTLGRDVLGNVMIWFCRWRRSWWFRNKKWSGFNHHNSSLVPTSSAQQGSPATDASQHLINLWHQLHSVLESNPNWENGVFVGKIKFCMEKYWVICIVYVCREFILDFSKLT